MTRLTDSSSHSEMVAPNNQEAEEAVLGAMLLNEKAIADVILLVSSEDFYRPANKAIFDAILAVYDRGDGTGVDPLTVSDELEGTTVLESVGGPSYLISLQTSAPVISHAPRYASIVRQHCIRRKMIATGNDLIAKGHQPSAEAASALADIGNSINDMSLAMAGERKYTTVEYASQGMDDLVEKWGGRSQKGTNTGFIALDKIIDGLHQGRFYVLGARPAQGKSVLAVNIATDFAINQGKTVLFFSMEMGEKEVAMRTMFSRSLISKNSMEAGWLTHSDWELIARTERELRNSNLILDSTPGISIQSIEARCRQIAASTGSLDLVVIDYLQLMGSSGRHGNRQEEIAALSRRLKALSMSLDVPVLALSQLSRKLEERSDPRPKVSDLRESGAIEQDADCVMLIHRDWDNENQSDNDGFTEIIVGKNRQGPLGVAQLAFIPEMSTFGNVTTAA